MTIFHISIWFKKHVENSLRGIRRAARGGYDAIDLDLLITSDGVIVCCHWDRPLQKDTYTDPAHRISIRAMVRHLTWAQIETLKTPDGFRIMRVERALEECAKLHIIAYLEPKDDPRFEQDWPWQHIVAVGKQYGTRIWVRSIKDFATLNAGVRRVQAAIRNGVPRRRTRIIRSK